MESIGRAVNRSYYEDGLFDLFYAVALILVGVTLIVHRTGILFIMVFILLLKKPLETMKRKYVYPRTGYVRQNPPEKETTRGIAITAVISSFMLALVLMFLIGTSGTVVGRTLFYRWIIPPAAGVLFALGPLWLYQKYGIRRALIQSILMLITGVAVAASGRVTGFPGVGVISLTGAAFSLITGSYLFHRFLKIEPLEGSS